MNVDLVIIPECFVDTNFIETINPPVKGYNHQKGCGNVAKLMQTKFNDSFALGIIDRDKKEIKYLNELRNRNSIQIILLSNWISYLKDNNYNAKIEEILEL